MSQNDFVIANASGASVRADMNSAFQALASASSGATAPSLTYQYQYWFDTTTNIQKQRNGANTAWVNLWSLVGSTLKLYEQGTLLLDRANTWSAEQTNAQGTRLGLSHNYIKGLGMNNAAGDPTNDVDVAVGAAADEANGYDLHLTTAITKRLDATWAVGTNQGGLDAGAKAPDSTYHVFLIARSDNGVVDVLFSLSISAPTLPTNYDKKRRIGSILTDSVAAPNSVIRPFLDFGNWRFWDTPIVEPTVTGDATNTLTMTPAGVRVLARVSVECLSQNLHAASQFGIYLRPLDFVGNTVAPQYNVPEQTNLGGRVEGAGVDNKKIGLIGLVDVLTDTSRQVRLDVVGGMVALDMSVHGYYDWRGEHG